ncbi:EamA family transporter [Phormidesmis sp. 146-12]
MALKSPHSACKPLVCYPSPAKLLGLLAMILTVVAWAIAANVANSLFLVGVSPFELAGVTTMIATFGFAILDSFFGRTQAQKLNGRELGLGIVRVGLVGADFLAIQRLPVAIAIVLLYTASIWVVLWTAFSSRTAPSRSLLVALLLSVLGVILVSNLLTSDRQQINGFGLVIGLSTAVFFAAYIVLSENLSTTREPIGVMLKTSAVASLVWLAYQFTQGFPSSLLTPENFPKVFFISIGGTLLPYLLFFWCIQRVQAEQAAITATLEPVAAAALAWVWFDQSLTLMQITGGVLIVFAVTWMQFKSSGSTLLKH